MASPERDILIVNVVNLFYADAASLLSLSYPPPFRQHYPLHSLQKLLQPSQPKQIFRYSIITHTLSSSRHLQRILDALPSAAQTYEGPRTVPVGQFEITTIEYRRS